jgi:uncharacterized protein
MSLTGLKLGRYLRMKKYIVYHGNCCDGFGAAWAAWKFWKDQGVYIPAFYSQDPQKIMNQIPMGADIYFVDFSFKREDIAKYRNLGFNIIVIDHHKSAINELKGLPDCVLDQSKSGAVLTWGYFHPGQRVPELLLYIQDRDLWRFDMYRSKECSLALRSYAFDFTLWENLSEHVTELIDQGVHILRFQTQIVKSICDQSYIGAMVNERLPIVNATAFWSEVGQEMLRRYPEYPCVASYYESKDQKRVWSLRSRSSFDASELAKKYGGGGHKQAAGFSEEL